MNDKLTSFVLTVLVLALATVALVFMGLSIKHAIEEPINIQSVIIVDQGDDCLNVIQYDRAVGYLCPDSTGTIFSYKSIR